MVHCFELHIAKNYMNTNPQATADFFYGSGLPIGHFVLFRHIAG
jgi:hypothetical protein